MIANLKYPIQLLFLGLILYVSDYSDKELKNMIHQDCGSCHGLTLGGGLGPGITPEAISKYDVDTLSKVILDGIPETAMPPWNALISEHDAKRIAVYLLSGEF